LGGIIVKRKFKLIDKLRVIWYWLFTHGDAITVNCHYCKSTQLNIMYSREEDNEYHSVYECSKCGAIAQNHETWHKSLGGIDYDSDGEI
jgi:hypothetical protein